MSSKPDRSETGTPIDDAVTPPETGVSPTEPTTEPAGEVAAAPVTESPETPEAAAVEPAAVAAEPTAPESPPSEPTRSDPSPAPTPSPTAKPAGGGRIAVAAVIAALAGGGLGVGGSYYLAQQTGSGDRTALETRLKAMETRLAAETDAAKKAVATDTDAAKKLAAADERLAAAEKALADLKAAMKPVDLAPLEARLAEIEKSPALKLPADVGARLAGLEESAKARLDAAQTSVAKALADLPAGVPQQALADFAAKVDAAVAAAREEAAVRTAHLEAKLAELANGASSAIAVDQTRIDELRAGLAAATRQIAEEVAKRNAEVAGIVDGMRQRLGGIEGLRGEVDALIGRLGGLESISKDAKTDRDRVAATLETTRAATDSRVGSVEEKLAALQAGADAAHRAQSDAVLAVALADLKSAVDTGRPFRGELDVVKRAAAGTLKFDGLEAFADKGVPSVATLRDRLPAVLRAMHEAEEARAAGGSGVMDRLLSHAGGVVRVRPAGDSAGTDLGALVSRVEARMKAGDLAGALAAWQALPEKSRTVSAEWGAALGARVGVDAALAAQTAAVVSKLSEPRQ